MSKRDDKTVLAAQAAQVVGNPAFKQAFDRQRERLISALETITLDGSEDADNKALASVRALQAALDFKREFKRMIQSGDREVRRQNEKDEPQPFDPTKV